MINQDVLKELLIANENIDKIKKELKELSDKKKLLEQKVLKSIEQNNLVDIQIETNKYNIDYTKRKSYQKMPCVFLRCSTSA